MTGRPDPADFQLWRDCTGAAATAALGEALAARLRGGEAILLWGDLGAGKTTLVQGVCRGLGCAETATSPTFNLAHRYHGRLVVHHLDGYRLGPGDDLHDIGLDAVLDEVAAGEAVLLAEWPRLLLPWLDAPLELLLEITGTDRRRVGLRGPAGAVAGLADLFTAGGAAC